MMSHKEKVNRITELTRYIQEKDFYHEEICGLLAATLVNLADLSESLTNENLEGYIDHMIKFTKN